MLFGLPSAHADEPCADASVADGPDLEQGALLEFLAGIEPGPEAMAVLAAIDPARLDPFLHVDLLRAWERQQSWLAAQMHIVVAGVAGSRPANEDDFVREDLACALGLSGNAAGYRLEAARMLAAHLHATRDLLEAGELSMRHAAAMVDECGSLDRSLIAEVEAQVLPKAPEQTVAELRRSIRRAIAAADPAAVECRREKAKAERSVRFVPEPDGMASIVARLAAEDARSVFLAVDALARGRHAAEGGRKSGIGIDARRADALVEIARAALAERQLPESQGRPVQLEVVIDLPTLMQLAEHPAELVGYGPLPASVARDLAGDAVWRRLVTDPVDGHLLDYGRTSYRPPQRLVDFVTARDRRCRFPGCGQPARRCDVDHAIPWSAGGETASANCGALCRRHHRLKTHGGWKLTVHADGVAVWKTRSGREYAVSPPDQLGA